MRTESRLTKADVHTFLNALPWMAEHIRTKSRKPVSLGWLFDLYYTGSYSQFDKIMFETSSTGHGKASINDLEIIANYLKRLVGIDKEEKNA